MIDPHLFTSLKDIERIKRHLQTYNWYSESYIHIKNIVDTFLKRGFNVPNQKGFVFFETCPRDNTELLFNPYNQDDYYCPLCGMNYKDEPYKRSWITRYHSWLSQMGILLGIVYLIDNNDVYANTLRHILLDYAKYYPSYPNNDNELGPTRIFQSTYMESVWIMYLAGAYDMVRNSKCFTCGERDFIENNLHKASINIILDYDEKMNNRQAFNNAAICAVGFLLEDKNLINYSLYGPHGFVLHMEKSVLEDGLWYEGDNYHFATLPSIVNIAEICIHNGIDLYSQEFNGHTIKMMYDAPLLSLQPDLTFPSRKDSKYETSIAQRLYSGLYELGYARYLAPKYAKILKTIYSFQGYDKSVISNSADVNNDITDITEISKPQAAKRNRLDWRGFLNAVPDLENYTGLPITHSVNMTGTGLAILRMDNKKIYTSVDYGKYGGGHGHPDRLNLNLFINGRRWLSDWGTCNYYLEHLRWYRSTIGHNTLVVDCSDQLPVDGKCVIFEETSMVSIASCQADEIAPDVDSLRTVILLKRHGILFDFLSGNSVFVHKYHYALHSFGELIVEGKESNYFPQLQGEGYSFIKDVYSYDVDNYFCVKFQDKDASLVIHSIGCGETTIFKGKSYGPPNQMAQLFPVLIIERNGNSADFINLMEVIEGDGGQQTVKSFLRINDKEYCIECIDRVKYIIFKDDCGWAVKIYDNGILTSIHSFSIGSIPGYAEFLFPLEKVECIFDSADWRINTQKMFGRLVFNDVVMKRFTADSIKVSVNDVEYNMEICGNKGIVSQKDCRFIRIDKNMIYWGIENIIEIELYNFTSKQWIHETRLNLPAGWIQKEVKTVCLDPFSVLKADVIIKPNNIGIISVNSNRKVCLVRYEATGDLVEFKVDNPLEDEVWIVKDVPINFIKLEIKNKTDIDLFVKYTVFENSNKFLLNKFESKVFAVDIDEKYISNGELSIPYNINVENYETNNVLKKSLVAAKAIGDNKPIDSFDWEPKIILNKSSQIRRAEKHWQGCKDLSGEAMICTNESGLILKVKIKDDRVLFSGGKYCFDNDSIQIYFDRREEKYRNLTSITQGIYGFIVVPGVFGNASSVITIGTEIKEIHRIGVSTYLANEGYEILMLIPWDCIGGKPKKGVVWGFDLIINDRDSGIRRDLQMIWTGCCEDERTYLMDKEHNPQRFGLLLL